MKIKDMPYVHPDMDKIRNEMTEIIDSVKNASTVDEILAAREKYIALNTEVYTAATLVNIRYTCNTADEFYVKENDYFDEISPELGNLSVQYGNALLDSPLRAELEKALTPIYFQYLEADRKVMSPAIIDDLKEENKIVSEYSKMMAGMEFEFRGEKMSRAMLSGYFKDDDRETRREAYTVMGNVLNGYKERLDNIYDRLVKVRTRMAHKMGYKNYVEFGYYKMHRICYGQDDVKRFRRNVLENITPVVSRMRSENAKKLGIDRYMLYDDGVIIKGGDPRPIGTKEDIFNAAREMYHKMGGEAADFIDMMFDADAFDVDARKNKWGGGYCTYIAKYKQPFILANFNGSAGDVDVMTHEAGHALNAYLIRNNRFVNEIDCGGMETAETHSMSMEFFAWKYIDKFFGENAEKYKFMHALDALSFIPYGTIVDYFQHIVYENPEMTPAERCEAWKKLDSEFRPHISTEGMPFLEEGRRWQYQMHIYESPFYYIDYCLAQTAAFGFLLASLENYDDAFAKYLRLSKQGGEKYWTDLLEEAGIVSPFKEGALTELATKVEKVLNDIAAGIAD